MNKKTNPSLWALFVAILFGGYLVFTHYIDVTYKYFLTWPPDITFGIEVVVLCGLVYMATRELLKAKKDQLKQKRRADELRQRIDELEQQLKQKR